MDLDENDLSIFQGMEVLTSDWNELQVALIWNNAPCATKDNVPLLSAMGSGTMKVDAIYYQQKDKVYYFFDCDLQGKKGEIKSWVYYKI